ESQLNTFLSSLRFEDGKRQTIIIEFMLGQGKVLDGCNTFVPEVKRLTHLLDEEQERGLEQELEEEKYIERPPPASEWTPIFRQELLQFIGDHSTLEILEKPSW